MPDWPNETAHDFPLLGDENGYSIKINYTELAGYDDSIVLLIRVFNGKNTSTKIYNSLSNINYPKTNYLIPNSNNYQLFSCDFSNNLKKEIIFNFENFNNYYDIWNLLPIKGNALISLNNDNNKNFEMKSNIIPLSFNIKGKENLVIKKNDTYSNNFIFYLSHVRKYNLIQLEKLHFGSNSFFYRDISFPLCF